MRRGRSGLGLLAFAGLLLASRGAQAQDLAPPSTSTSSPPPATDTTPPPAATPPAAAETPPPADAKPPPAPATTPPPGAAERPEAQGTQAKADEKKDSGRGLEWVYLNADGGFAYTDMGSFGSTKLSVQNTPSSGPTFGVGAGIRLFILTIGARANLDLLSSYDLWRLDGEIGIHIPIGHWDPYIGLHGGYCFVGSLQDGLSGSSNVSISGGDAGLALGVDYYFNHFVSLGLEASGSILFLHSAPPALPAGSSSALSPSESMLYQQTGDSVGLGVVGSLHLGFHI